MRTDSPLVEHGRKLGSPYKRQNNSTTVLNKLLITIVGCYDTIADKRQFTPAHSLFCMDLTHMFTRKLGGRAENRGKSPLVV